MPFAPTRPSPHATLWGWIPAFWRGLGVAFDSAYGTIGGRHEQSDDGFDPGWPFLPGRLPGSPVSASSNHATSQDR